MGKLGDPEDSLDLVSACLQTPQQWTFHSKDYRVGADSAPGYDPCMAEVKSVLDKMDIDQCEEVPTRKIAAFSYFHDRAVDAVQQYLDAARTVCSSPSPSQPFLCVDLTFISGLLHHGYKLAADAKLGLYKRIDGHETSWGLGAAFNLLD